MQLSKLAGFATHGIRALLYAGLLVTILIFKYSFTNIEIICMTIIMVLYALSVCFPETVATSVKYKAAFEIVVTVIVFVGDRLGLNVNFILGLVLLLGLNLTFMMCVVADNNQK